MNDLNQFLNSVEASARKILKQQNKKQQESIAHERAELARAAKNGGRASPTKLSTSISREELKATYSTNGIFLIQAPPPAPSNESSGPRSPHRSEHVSDTNESYLPRISQSPSQQNLQIPSTIERSVLPVLHRQQQGVIDAARKAQRDKRTVEKITSSPLYKSLARSKHIADHHEGTFGGTNQSTTQSIRKAVHDVDSVNLILKRLGMRDSSSPTKRPAHAVERRMCHACWAHPDKQTGCEHHPRTGSTFIGPSLELQGPTSWYTDDLYVKYRCEHERERLWHAYLELKQQQETSLEPDPIHVVPIMVRHPFYAIYTKSIEYENLLVQAETRRRNGTKSFIFNVNHLWLTNLDHFNQQQRQETNGLRDRRDEHAIRQGYSQIQSISTARALENAVFTNSVETPAQGIAKPEMIIPRRKRSIPSSFRPPLTLLVCGAWNPKDENSSLVRVPGVSLLHHPSILWWTYPYQDDPTFEYNRVIALYSRSAHHSSSNTILVLVQVAIDTPILSPYWFAWYVGSKAPPPICNEPIRNLPPPVMYSSCLQSLRSTKLQTRLDSLLPSTLVVLNSLATIEDHQSGLEEPYGHRRFWSEYTHHDMFRQWYLLPLKTLVLPHYLVETQPVYLQMAQPNTTSVGGRFTWHSIDEIGHALNRLRLPIDYLILLINTKPSTSQDPSTFEITMQHESFKDVHVTALRVYLQRMEQRRQQQEYELKRIEIEKKIEIGRLALEAKRAEQVRIEQRIEVNRVERIEMNEATRLEWEQRLEESIIKEEKNGWQIREMKESRDIIFYYSLNPTLPFANRVSWTRPFDIQQDGQETARSSISTVTDTSEREEEQVLDHQQQEITDMASALLADQQFLTLLKDKLGLSKEVQEKPVPSRNVHDSTIKEEEEMGLNLDDHIMKWNEELNPSQTQLMVNKLTKLHLYGSSNTISRGEGWKRLKASALPPTFTHKVYSTHTQSPRSVFINQPNHSTPVGMIDPRQASRYEIPDFIPELKVQFIPKPHADLQARLQLVHEVTNTRSGYKESGYKESLFKEDSQIQTMEQMIEKAILYARNNNLEMLETLLDDGVDINARDIHGNTLFILVCQQGNKKMAKFLMRRHADMNVQNLNGNTALHYLIEYKHMELAEYIKSKGAQDTIQNAMGLTCYEGLSTEQVEAL